MKPLLVYDGDCGFCRFWIERWRDRLGDRVDCAPSHEVAGRFPQISPAEFDNAVQFIDGDGAVYAGAEGVFRALDFATGSGWRMRAWRSIPGYARLCDATYRLVARHRAAFSFLTRLAFGERPERPTYRIASCLLVRGIGLTYLIAFLSLWTQILGLAGEQGISPARLWLDNVGAQLGTERFWAVPTLFWIDAGDGALIGLCVAGTLLAALVLGGLFTGPCLALLWIAYLSLVSVCRPFLNFQWDILLLEAGFLALFIAPWRWRCRIPCARAAPRPAIWLTAWLLFKLMFSSGVVKLTSGDPTWWNLTALEVHYETQPLPTWTAWYAHQLPGTIQAISCALMFAVELAVPFLIFAPRRLRLIGCGLLIGFQLLIAATGNYTFFNLLTVVLCLVLIDDAAWPRRWRDATTAAPPRRWPRWVAVPTIALFVLLSVASTTRRWRLSTTWPEPIRQVQSFLAPFHVIGVYGLFANMTESRPEIIVEGSNDGRRWLAYEFKWKPGDPSRRPRFVAPHQPRLDWQMWFAALGDYRRNRWFTNFQYRLLQGTPEVLALLETNPFPEAPPRYIRAVVFDYRFTDFPTRRAQGTWWRRTPQRLYSPTRSLSQD